MRERSIKTFYDTLNNASFRHVTSNDVACFSFCPKKHGFMRFPGFFCSVKCYYFSVERHSGFIPNFAVMGSKWGQNEVKMGSKWGQIKDITADGNI